MTPLCFKGDGMIIILLCAQENVYTFVMMNQNLNWRVIQGKEISMKLNLVKNMSVMMV